MPGSDVRNRAAGDSIAALSGAACTAVLRRRASSECPVLRGGQPHSMDVSDQLHQSIESKRLYQIRICSANVGAPDIVLQFRTGKHDDWDIAHTWGAADPAQNFKSSRARHLQV